MTPITSTSTIGPFTSKGSVANFVQMTYMRPSKTAKVSVVISFKGSQFPRDVILHAVFFYVRYAVSYRNLVEVLAERGVHVGHASLNSWVVKYASALAKAAQKRKMPTALSWRLDETYVKVRGDSCCLNIATKPLPYGF